MFTLMFSRLLVVHDFICDQEGSTSTVIMHYNGAYCGAALALHFCSSCLMFTHFILHAYI